MLNLVYTAFRRKKESSGESSASEISRRAIVNNL